MKKIIMAAAALTAGIVMAADDSIVSSTVVGYQKQDLTGLQCNSIGPTFVSANAKTIKLGDIKVDGFLYNDEMLQVLSTDNAATIAKYTYVTPEWDAEDFDGDGEAVGWWIKGYEGKDKEKYSANGLPWASGQALLGYFSKESVKLTFPSAL